MKATFQTIDGTYDILPGPAGGNPMLRVEAWRHVEDIIRCVMRRFAFEEIRTPVLEPMELIARGVGQLTDIVSKEMFCVERGTSTYVLRPEMTAPVMRAFLQHHLEQRGGEQRLFYIGPCFRAERPQKGRYRQFHQFGAELIGASDARADAEIIALNMAIYREFGIEASVLRINTLGDAHSRPRYRDALRKYLEPFRAELSPVSQERLKTNPLRILDTKEKNERKLLDSAPRLIDYVDGDSREHYEALKGFLEDLSVAYVEDPFLVRGLDYYTRTAFEIESPHLGAQNSLAGGGRYDLLAGEIGSSTTVPGVGFAAGMERLLLALEVSGATLPGTPPLDAFLIALGDAAARVVFRQALRLREAGLRVTYDLRGRSMKAQMRAAHRYSARHAVILGDEELRTGQAQVKTMDTGRQLPVSLEDLSTYLSDQET